MLSQSEIDALLSGAIELDKPEDGTVNLAELMGQSSGTASGPKEVSGLSDKKVQAYNFWSPDRFSKEQMRAVELVHEDLGERLTTSLPTFLRTSLRPRLVHTEQGRFSDFLNDLPGNSLFHMINLAPLPGQMVLTISPNISYIILEQRLGGKSEGSRRERPLTDIDQSLLRGLVEHMLNDIKMAWGKMVNIEPGLEDSTVNQHWVQMLMGNDRVMLITFELSIQNISGTMNLYIPFGLLKPIANVLNPHVWITGRKEKVIDPVQRQAAIKSLGSVPLPVRVYLGNAMLSLGELANLKSGDVIQLDKSVRQKLSVQVANQVLFRGQIGRSGNHLAVQVTAAAHEDIENE